MPSEGIGYLINLRHIHFYGEEQMPANIGRLTSLQTLQDSFYVGTRKGLKIEELGSLSKLKGSLKIRYLERVNDKLEAKQAKLHEKAVDELELWWELGRSEVELEGNHDEEVLEGLRPHPNLQRLVIDCYGEEVEESLDFSFIHHIHASLEKLSLDGWEKLTQLPHQIQHLIALRELEIRNFSKLDALPE
ncbi:hypothetical protein SLEP1_g60533, partial [Rubroshorea leprosula]